MSFTVVFAIMAGTLAFALFMNGKEVREVSVASNAKRSGGGFFVGCFKAVLWGLFAIMLLYMFVL